MTVGLLLSYDFTRIYQENCLFQYGWLKNMFSHLIFPSVSFRVVILIYLNNTLLISIGWFSINHRTSTSKPTKPTTASAENTEQPTHHTNTVDWKRGLHLDRRNALRLKMSFATILVKNLGGGKIIWERKLMLCVVSRTVYCSSVALFAKDLSTV